MRIIAGSKARMNLLGPRDLTTRPITDRVKESLFSILTPNHENARVADLFCGTGSLGLEALSRGARHAIMEERDRDALKRLRKNIAKLQFENQTTVIATDITRSGIVYRDIPSDIDNNRCDLVFVDPPFPLSRDVSLDSPLGKLFVKLSNQIDRGALVVARHARKTELLKEYARLFEQDRREYGSMAITFLVKE